MVASLVLICGVQDRIQIMCTQSGRILSEYCRLTDYSTVLPWISGHRRIFFLSCPYRVSVMFNRVVNRRRGTGWTIGTTRWSFLICFYNN